MDKETFTRQAMERQRTLYRIALSYTASAADAEDAVQEALLRAWDKRHTLREAATMLRLPLGTVKTRVARAKKRLEKEAKDHA